MPTSLLTHRPGNIRKLPRVGQCCLMLALFLASVGPIEARGAAESPGCGA